MYGKKIRIAYRGMVTVCSNCYDVNHMRVECPNTRANYLDYVSMLMKTGRFEKNLFGSWAKRVENYEKFKQDQRKDKRLDKITHAQLVTLEEESYVDNETDPEVSINTSKPKKPEKSNEQKDDDTSSMSSFKSSNNETTMVEDCEDSEQTQSSSMLAKFGSFIGAINKQ